MTNTMLLSGNREIGIDFKNLQLFNSDRLFVIKKEYADLFSKRDFKIQKRGVKMLDIFLPVLKTEEDKGVFHFSEASGRKN